LPEDRHQHSRGRLSVFRWDINIRESTILGLVGAEGIGLQLQASLNVLAWPQVAVIRIAIFISVLVSEWVSAKVRHAIICPPLISAG
jgi:phosphonate transport system permease protein